MPAISNQNSQRSTLKELLSYYRDIIETTREPFIILDKKLKVVIANSAFYRTFKVLKKDTMGESIYKLGNGQWDGSQLRELLENILPKNRVLYNFEVTHDFPDMGQKTMLLNATQVDSKELVLLSIKDVTKQNQLRRDSAKVTASLIEQRDKLKGLSDAKDEFIMLASHQLRTPATAVKQYVGMLIEGYGGRLSTTQLNMLNSAYESNERQLVIIEDLLKIARVDEGKVYLARASYDLAQQIEEVIQDQLSTSDGRQQDIVFNRPLEQAIVFVDEKLMRMVLENLIDNASKYSYTGKKITIDLTQNHKHTIVAVKDRGVGITKKDQHKLFQRFSRIHNPLSMSVNGSGLGLYWVKKILDLHGGSMEVISRVNRGSTFIIDLPTLEYEEAAESAQNSLASPSF